MRPLLSPWLLISTAALAAVPDRAATQVWNEVGDAGDLPATAQIPAGSGALTTITGSLLPNGDADLFLIQIDDPLVFEATTCPTTAVDTQLWLFATSGDGITFDDDDPGCGVLSTISGAHVLSAGRYYLGCSAYDWDALNPHGQEIWLDEPYDEERPPDGPGAPGPVASWGENGFESGPYEIALIGVSWPIIGIAESPLPDTPGARLHESFPNPFGSRTTIRYELAEPGPARLTVYDATGRLVRLLIAEPRVAAAAHQVIWNRRDDSGYPVPGGVYFYRLDAGPCSQTRRVVALR